MDGIIKQKYWVTGVRWGTRIYAGLLTALILTIIVGESFFCTGGGLPNPFTQPLPVAIELLGMFAMLTGCIIGLKWHGGGAILVIGGIMTFHVVERRLWLMGALPLFDLAGILFFVCYILQKLQIKRKKQHL